MAQGLPPWDPLELGAVPLHCQREGTWAPQPPAGAPLMTVTAVSLLQLVPRYLHDVYQATAAEDGPLREWQVLLIHRPRAPVQKRKSSLSTHFPFPPAPLLLWGSVCSRLNLSFNSLCQPLEV